MSNMPDGRKKVQSALLYITYVVLFIFSIAASAEQLSSIDTQAPFTVVMDDNYPPYIQRNADGALGGYLVDIWELWQTKTGVTVNLVAAD